MNTKSLSEQLDKIGQELNGSDPSFPFLALTLELKREKFLEILNRKENREIKILFERAITLNRTDYIVALRTDFVKILRDKYGFSYPLIGQLLKRDHSTIMHLYKK